jgi:hypothetical protein
MEIGKEEFMLREKIKAETQAELQAESIKNRLFFRIQLALSDNIQSKERDLILYKSLEGGEELVELTSEKLTQLKSDLEKLKNL